jgi:hypothetical protein
MHAIAKPNYADRQERGRLMANFPNRQLKATHLTSELGHLRARRPPRTILPSQSSLQATTPGNPYTRQKLEKSVSSKTLVEFSRLVFLGSCRIKQAQDSPSASTVRRCARKDKATSVLDAFFPFCKLSDRNKADSRADGLRSLVTMIDHDGQTSLESIMNLISGSFGP